MWYNRLSEFLRLKGYTNNDDCPCVFIKKLSIGFCIISVYVDDINIIIGNEPDINEARHHLKTEFETKDFGQTKFCFRYIYIPSCLCLKSIGEIQYGQVISNKNPDGSEIHKY
jgi:hypothetical protein